MKTLLKLAVFSIAGIAMAQPIARPTYPAYASPTNNGISTIYHQNKNTILSPPKVRSIINTGGSDYVVLVQQSNPGAYHTSLINLGQYLNYFRYYKNDPNPKLVVYIAGGQGGSVNLPDTPVEVLGGTGGITIFTVPLLKFIQTFGNNVIFYYVVGGSGGGENVNNPNCAGDGTQQTANSGAVYSGTANSGAANSGTAYPSYCNAAGGGGGASMVAVKNWPHDGGTALAIAGGGGGGSNIAYSNPPGESGGGGGGGNDPGQSSLLPEGMTLSEACKQGYGLSYGGNQGAGGAFYICNTMSYGGTANPNVIDISGGGGGLACTGTGAGSIISGGGGGTGGAGENGGGFDCSPGYGGDGYYPGGGGQIGLQGQFGYGGGVGNSQWGAGLSANGGTGLFANGETGLSANSGFVVGGGPNGGFVVGGGPNGGFGGGGEASAGLGAGGGGGYGGGAGGYNAGGGGGGGYCLDANHPPANNPSLGAELGSTCQASDWTNGGGNYGNGYVYIYIEP